MDISSAHAWVICIGFFLIIEAITPNFVTIWFAVGALAAVITSLLTPNGGIQMLVFVVVTALSIILTLPLVRKMRARKNATPLNADRNIGRSAVVVTALVPGDTGRVRLDGVEWAAQSAHPLAIGEACRVTALDSTLLSVEPMPATAPV